ncbi:MAG: iron-containing alcohol dehydrogenase [Eubacteriales bacterium]|nr:iron-containing alcohol dehydrogenase [Eubacteriales bacterium]
MKGFSFSVLTKIIYEENAVQTKLYSELKANNIKHPCIITDKGIAGCGLLSRITCELDKHDDIRYTVFDSVEVNPTEVEIDRGYSVAKAANCDAIIGFGGGSSLDSAKAIAMLMENGGEVLDYCTGKRTIEKPVRNLFEIPTTAGTGSEITKIFVVINSKTRFKAGFKNDLLAPNVAILDPMMLLGLPQHILAATCMDSLSHAIEGYTSKGANLMTDFYMEKSIAMIGENLRGAYANPGNIECQSNLMLACAINACAFQQSGLGLVHSMGHALGGRYNIPHGVSCSLCLPVAVDFNSISNPARFAKIAQMLGEAGFTGNANEDCHLAAKAIRRLMKDINLPMTLSDLKLSETDIPALVEDTMKATGMLGINGRNVCAGDVEKLWRELL